MWFQALLISCIYFIIAACVLETAASTQVTRRIRLITTVLGVVFAVAGTVLCAYGISYFG